MRLSFYSGLAVAMIAADTAEGAKLELANQVVEIEDDMDWSLSQNMADEEASLFAEADTALDKGEVDEDHDAGADIDVES